jgi:hypothetical protein
MVVLFVGVESTFAYFEATHRYLKRYGKPLAFYSDKASVFSGSRRPVSTHGTRMWNFAFRRKYETSLADPIGP